MKVEFLVALTDHTWYTQIVEMPDGTTMTNDQASQWAYEHITLFPGDVALIAVYCDNLEDEFDDNFDDDDET